MTNQLQAPNPFFSVRRGAATFIVGLLATFCASVLVAERLELETVRLEIPGPPVSILSSDLNGDGYPDLSILTAYVDWDQIAIEEQVEMEGIDGLVEAMTIVPALFDRREIWVFLGTSAGSYETSGRFVAIDDTVHGLEVGPPGLAVLALTDEGLSWLRLTPEGDPELQPLLVQETVLSGSAVLLPTLDLVQDYDGDGELDVLLPTETDFRLYSSGDLLETRSRVLETETVQTVSPTTVLQLPEEPLHQVVREIPLPLVRDLDGDGRPELLVRGPEMSWSKVQILKNEGDFQFSEPSQPLADLALRQTAARPEGWEEEKTAVIFVGDLDGDGFAEAVTEENLSDDESLKEMKRPPMQTSIWGLGSDFEAEGVPRVSFPTLGYAQADGTSSGESLAIPGGFTDLDGDSRQDLVTVTLNFSMLQAVRIMATKSISLGLDFHVYCQEADGKFSKVTGLDLSGKFKLRLNDLRIGQLSQFAGDFDGDGRRDFLQIGRGKNVSLHRGREQCRYPAEPDLKIRLTREPRDMSLVQVDDWNQDGFSDLLIVHPRKSEEAEVTPAADLDFYLSKGQR